MNILFEVDKYRNYNTVYEVNIAGNDTVQEGYG